MLKYYTDIMQIFIVFQTNQTRRKSQRTQDEGSWLKGFGAWWN